MRSSIAAAFGCCPREGDSGGNHPIANPSATTAAAATAPDSGATIQGDTGRFFAAAARSGAVSGCGWASEGAD